MATKARTIRIPADDLVRIDRQAAALGMSRSGYMIACARAGGPAPDLVWREEVDARLELVETMEARLKRLEDLTFGAVTRVQALG